MPKQHAPNNKKPQQKIASIRSTAHPSNQCNCKVKNTCPQLGKCQYKNVIYKATVKHYIDSTEGTIKQRIYYHKLSYKNRNYSSRTSLSLYIWHLKDTNICSTITWEILKLAPTYNKTLKKCLLCPHEKLAIITYPSQNTLQNKKCEIVS